jgi:HK97 family phage portal protein
MSFIRRILGRPAEQRAGDPSWSSMASLSPSGTAVNARTAEGLSTVLACVDAIGGALAGLPAWVYRRGADDRTIDEGHSLMRLVRNGPNDWQTWPDFVQWLTAQTLLRGNGLAEIVTDSRGNVAAMKPIPWEWVSVSLLPSGRLAYDVTELTSVYGGQGRMRRLLQGEVLHLKDRSDDGLVGRSRLSRAAAVVNAGLAIQDFAESMFSNGVNPSGAFRVEQKLSQDQYTRLRQQFTEKFAGTRNAARALILEGGATWQQISVSPEDAELLASRRFSVEELARVYQVPAPIIGDLSHGTFTNSETLIRFFAVSTLATWCRKIEAEFARSVFSDSDRQTHEIELDLSGLLRGDPEARWRSNEIAVKNRILTTNEVRYLEGYNPLPGGDEFSLGNQPNEQYV